MRKEDWAERMNTAMEAGQQPPYDLLREGVDVLLAEHSQLSTAFLDMSTKLGAILMARRAGNTAKALQIIDRLIATHVVLASADSSKTH